MAGADMGLGGGYGAGGVSEAIGKILAQRALAQQLAETARSHQADEALKQQQIDEQAKYREMQQQGIQQDRAVNEGARLAGTLSPGDSLLNQPNTVNRLMAGGQGPNIGVVPPLSASPIPSGASVPALPSGTDSGQASGDVLRTGPSVSAPLTPPAPGAIGNVSWLGTPQERTQQTEVRRREGVANDPNTSPALRSFLRVAGPTDKIPYELITQPNGPPGTTNDGNYMLHGKPIVAVRNKGRLTYQGQDVTDQVTPYVAPPTAASSDGRLDKSYQFNSTQLEKERTPLAQKMDKLQTGAEMIAQHTPQADALVAPLVLSVSAGGAGSGLRMNEAEISRIIGGRSKWESLKASLAQWSSDPTKALSITNEQRNEIGAILDAAHGRIKSKLDLIDQAGSDLVNAPDVATHRKIVSETKRKLDALNSSAGGGTVHMKAPDGRDLQVPPEKVQELQQHGAVVVK